MWKRKINGLQNWHLFCASAGSAIGLGAIWKFPYVAGTSGGGVFYSYFYFIYVIVGLPLLLGEFIYW